MFVSPRLFIDPMDPAEAPIGATSLASAAPWHDERSSSGDFPMTFTKMFPGWPNHQEIILGVYIQSIILLYPE